MSELIMRLNLKDHDQFYANLLTAHDGLSLEDTHAYNARLILILANHIGDNMVLTQALDAACKS